MVLRKEIIVIVHLMLQTQYFHLILDMMNPAPDGVCPFKLEPSSG